MEILDREDDIALVLMGVMMPELDGYATTAAKSIASGASEYVTEPVDISHLIGLMRGWPERQPRPAGRPPTHPRTEGSG